MSSRNYKKQFQYLSKYYKKQQVKLHNNSRNFLGYKLHSLKSIITPRFFQKKKKNYNSSYVTSPITFQFHDLALSIYHFNNRQFLLFENNSIPLFFI